MIGNRERELRHAAQAEHRETAVTGDEADGEHAGGASLDLLDRVDKRPCAGAGSSRRAVAGPSGDPLPRPLF